MENNNLSKKELNKMLKENNYKIPNENINSFVSLKDLNKIYPNGVQAVYDFSLDINKNEFIVFVGPSGCGKSTTLRMIAGLEDITSGYLYIDKVLSNYVASKDRDISMVFQNYALYPQMTVYENIAFPLRARKYKMPLIADTLLAINQAKDILNNRLNDYQIAKEQANDKDITFSTKIEYIATKLIVSDMAIKLLNKNKDINDSNKESILLSLNQLEANQKDKYLSKGYSIDDNYKLSLNNEPQYISRKYKEQEIREKVFEAASILDLGSYLDRRPAELSGGQMQRVALGRAIVRNAKLFLMDEPLSNLDAKLRVQMRSEIVRIHEQIEATTIYVTHDQTEAMTMANRIVVMSKGWVQQIGEPEEIYNHPKNIFVATFIGSPAMNIFNGVYDQGVITLNNGYQIKLSKEIMKRHDQYFQNKIIDLKRLIETEDFLKLKTLKEIDKVLFAEDSQLDNEFIKEQTTKIIELSSSFNKDEDYKKVLEKLQNYPINQGFNGKIKHIYLQIRKFLLTLNNISSADLGKLHNAQMFSNHEVVNNDALYYQKPKKKKKEYAHKYNLHSASIEFENNLYDVAIELLDKCEKSLNEPHSIRIGVRPEDIHINESLNSHKTNPFNVNTNMVELLGSELLLYFSWANQDVIAKVSTDRLIKPHSDVTLTINEEKIHIFDDACGDTI